MPRTALASLPLLLLLTGGGSIAAAGPVAAVVPAAAAVDPVLADTVTASPGTQTFTTKDALVDVLDGPAGDHAASIDTRLYLPSGASAASPQPAILITHGFGLNKLSPEVVANATFLARHGYVVLTYTAQGFGASSGCVTLQSRTYDVKDAQQLITKVLEPLPQVKKDAEGAVVATVGGSYGGGIQANLAETDGRIRAIAPGRTWNTLQYSLDPNNYVHPDDPNGFTHLLNDQGVFKQEWTSLFFASGNSNPATGAGGCPQEKLASGDPLQVAGAACPGFRLEVCQTFLGLTGTGDSTAADRALLADAAATTEIAKLRVPTLLVQGQSDTLFNVNDAIATYLALEKNGVPVKMIWNSGGHGGYTSAPGECEVYGGGPGVEGDFSGLDDCYLTLRTLAFLDHVLKGAPDPHPDFTYYRDWVAYGGAGANDEQFGGAATFPAMTSTTFTLSGSDALVTTGAAAGSATFVNPPGGVPPAYTETSNQTGPGSSPRVPLPPVEQPGQNVSFTTTPFDAPFDSVGVPEATLRLSHLAPTDLVLFGKVYDVAPDGTATLIHRLISPVRVPAAAVDRPVRMKLLGFAHRFDTGHSARLTLAATDATSYNNKVADAITVTTGAGSTFALPGSPAAVATPPVGAGGPVTAPPATPAGGRLAATGPVAWLPAGGLLALVAVGLRRRRAPRRAASAGGLRPAP